VLLESPPDPVKNFLQFKLSILCFYLPPPNRDAPDSTKLDPRFRKLIFAFTTLARVLIFPATAPAAASPATPVARAPPAAPRPRPRMGASKNRSSREKPTPGVGAVEPCGAKKLRTRSWEDEII
jgi:hypothetical protein